MKKIMDITRIKKLEDGVEIGEESNYIYLTGSYITSTSVAAEEALVC